jgi:hypothetical protein
MKRWCILTQARLYPVLSDSKGIDDTELMCMCAGEIIICRARVTSMTKMKDQAKFL